MNRTFSTVWICLTLACGAAFAQAKADPFLESKDAYLGQARPGDTPELFAQDLISVRGRNEAAISFSPDGRQCLVFINQWPNSYAVFLEFKGGKWTEPERAWFSAARAVTEPVFSADGGRIYFSSAERTNSRGGWDLFYLEKKDGGWSEPINLGATVNSASDEFHPCVIGDGSIYFTDNVGNIAKCEVQNGKFKERALLPDPINLKSNPNGMSWGDPFVSPNEKYLIFKSNRPGGFGSNDIYLAFRNKDGSWSQPKNLGEKINSSFDETSGDITFDGKYMFFGRGGDIYWVNTDFLGKAR